MQRVMIIMTTIFWSFEYLLSETNMHVTVYIIVSISMRHHLEFWNLLTQHIAVSHQM